MVDHRLQTIEKSLQAIRESRDNETKSSVGDKYETGRAMLQIEEDNYQKQLHQVLLLKNQLQKINLKNVGDGVQQGSLVITGQASYFISVGLGKIEMERQSYFCISPVSPVARKLLNRKAGDQFEFNGRTVEIKEIY